MDVRSAIVRARDEQGLSYVDIAALLDVCESTVTRVLRRDRESGLGRSGVSRRWEFLADSGRARAPIARPRRGDARCDHR
jgi:IS30 family transposase